MDSARPSKRARRPRVHGEPEDRVVPGPVELRVARRDDGLAQLRLRSAAQGHRDPATREEIAKGYVTSQLKL